MGPGKKNASRPAGRPRQEVPPKLVHQLREKGLSFRAIAHQTGFGYGSVRRAYRNYTEKSGKSD